MAAAFASFGLATLVTVAAPKFSSHPAPAGVRYPKRAVNGRR